MQVSLFISRNTGLLLFIVFNSCFKHCLISFYSKTALLEGLEVDQYMWGILNAIQKYVETHLKCTFIFINFLMS